MLKRIIIYFRRNKKCSGKSNFFDYPSREKKKIIKAAVKQANQRQLKLVKQYQMFCVKDGKNSVTAN